MFNKYLRIAIRLLIKKPGYTLIHVLGLSVGLSCFFILALFIAHELSYDSFHTKQDRIYRIGKKGFTERFLGTDEWVRTAYPLGETLTSDFPEVTAQVKITESISFFEKGTDRYRVFNGRLANDFHSQDQPFPNP
ncbi:MAG: hypothetical protein AAFW89_11105 [Bacteroidota bacterium]